jgi:hypothetical protein
MTRWHIRRRCLSVLETAGTLVCVWGLTVAIVARVLRPGGATDE